MKKIFIFLFMAIFLYAVAANADEVTSSQALKSFSAWSILHYKDYGGNWEEMWQAWLEDPEVPLSIREKGVEDREEIRQEMENLKGSIATFREQAEESGKAALEQGKSWWEELKRSTGKAIDESLNKAIKGE